MQHLLAQAYFTKTSAVTTIGMKASRLTAAQFQRIPVSILNSTTFYNVGPPNDSVQLAYNFNNYDSYNYSSWGL